MSSAELALEVVKVVKAVKNKTFAYLFLPLFFFFFFFFFCRQTAISDCLLQSLCFLSSMRYIVQNRRKEVLCHMQIAKAKVSLWIRLAWLGPSLLVDIFFSIHGFWKRQGRFWSDCICAGWSVFLAWTCGKDIFLILQNAYFMTKTYLYNFDPLKPYFHIVKLGFTRVYIIFLLKTIDYG